MGFQRKISDEILAEIAEVARIKAALPTPKELSARTGCPIGTIYHYMRRFEFQARIANTPISRKPDKT